MGPTGQFCMHHDDNSETAANASRATTRARSLRVRTAGDSLILCLPSFPSKHPEAWESSVLLKQESWSAFFFGAALLLPGCSSTKTRARGSRSTRVFPFRHKFEHQRIRARTASNRTSGETETFRWRFHDLGHFFCSWALSKDGLARGR